MSYVKLIQKAKPGNRATGVDIQTLEIDGVGILQYIRGIEYRQFPNSLAEITLYGWADDIQIEGEATFSIGASMIGKERFLQLGKYPIERDVIERFEQSLGGAASYVMRRGEGDIPEHAGSELGRSIMEKHPERIEQLRIAGALIAAEIDRMIWAEKRGIQS